MKRITLLKREDSCDLLLLDKELAEAEGFKTSIDGPHLCVEIPSEVFTISIKNKDGRTVLVRLNKIGVLTILDHKKDDLSDLSSLPWEK